MNTDKQDSDQPCDSSNSELARDSHKDCTEPFNVPVFWLMGIGLFAWALVGKHPSITAIISAGMVLITALLLVGSLRPYWIKHDIILLS